MSKLKVEEKIEIAKMAATIAAGYVSTINSQADYNRLHYLAKRQDLDGVSDWITLHSLSQAKDIYINALSMV